MSFAGETVLECLTTACTDLKEKNDSYCGYTTVLSQDTCLVHVDYDRVQSYTNCVLQAWLRESVRIMCSGRCPKIMKSSKD